jgi:cyanate permease
MPSVATLGGFRAVYLVTAGLAVVIGAVSLAQKPVRELPIESAEDTSFHALGRTLGAVMTNGRVWLLGLFNAASIAVGTAVMVWTPDFLQGEYGSSVGVAAYLTAGLAVAQLVGAPTGAAAAIRWGRMPIITGSMVAMSVVTILVPVVPGRLLVFVMVALVGFFSLAYFSPRFAMIPEVVSRPEHVGPASGLINLLGFGISTFAPWLFGLVLDRGLGYLVAYLVLAAFGVAGAVGSLFFKVSKEPVALETSDRPAGTSG